MFVGSTSDEKEFFKGFIYSIEIYISSPNIDSLVTYDCDVCSVCNTTGTCFPICGITSFPLTSLVCNQCAVNCVNGCRNTENCSLCDDPNCYSCDKYDPNSCLVCNFNYEILDFNCVSCSFNTYYDNLAKICKKCVGLCETCSSDTVCISCVENSSLNSNCECNLGYSGTTTCKRNEFNAIVTIDLSNNPTIIFAEELNSTLLPNDLSIFIDQTKQTFNLSMTDDFSYLITINFVANVVEGDILTISLRTDLISKKNSILATSVLKGRLFASSYNDLLAQINAMKQYCQIGLAIGLSAALGTSAVSVDPTSFFNFLNSVQIYSYIVLYQLDLDPVLIELLSSLQPSSYIPSIFPYFMNQSEGVKMNEKLNSFGYPSNFFMINSGLNLTILSSFIAFTVLIYYFQEFNNL